MKLEQMTENPDKVTTFKNFKEKGKSLNNNQELSSIEK